MYEERYIEQDLGFIRPKYIVMEGLKRKLAEMPNLQHSFDLTYEYPRQESQAQDPRSGRTVIRRKVVIKKVQSAPTVKGIGQTYASETFIDEETRNQLAAEGVGQVDTHTIEISVWSPESTDRDLLIDLIKIWMLELNRNVEETGLPFFYERGIYAVDEVRNYETIDRGNASTPFHVGIIVYNLLCPFYGVHTDRFQKYKYDIINKIIDNTDIPGDTIIIPNPPTTQTPIGGGGGGSGGGSTGDGGHDVVVVPDSQPMPPRTNIGGSYESWNDDVIIIPGPNTEERTVQSVVLNTEE